MAKKKAKNKELAAQKSELFPTTPALLGDIRGLIEAAREQTARAVNSTLVALYWQIGRRIREDVLANERAEYGQEIVATLSGQLTAEYGRGFGRRNLFRMVQFSEYFPDVRIVSALSTQLGWSHFVEILSLEDRLKREFYTEMCRVERWSVRTLRHKIGHVMQEAAMACFLEVDSALLDCRLPMTGRCKQRLTAKDVVERLFGFYNQPGK